MAIYLADIRLCQSFTYSSRQGSYPQLQSAFIFNQLCYISGYLYVALSRHRHRHFDKRRIRTFNNMIDIRQRDLVLDPMCLFKITVHFNYQFFARLRMSRTARDLRPVIKITFFIHRCDLQDSDIRMNYVSHVPCIFME